ncbi:MAG TPA: dual specificity protein phosphatase family protein [Blastocatellia bacterium]|nr:dual specificity protein phosphatase family protein [Blastocatellia bacterium]
MNFQTRFLKSLFVGAALFALVAMSIAQTGVVNSPAVRIKNFGSVNNQYYRGAQPEGQDYAALAGLGVKTVIDVHKNGPKGEAAAAEAAGMKFVRIPLNETEAPTAAQVAQFLSLVNDPANQPVFVHCAGGRHRTGTLTAIYRMTHDGWTVEQAFDEMKRYEFLKNGDHSELKNFVFAYGKQLQGQGTATGSER